MLFPLLLLAVSAMGQQDLFQWRIAAHAGITRSLSDIESSYNDVNWDRSRVQGLELSKSLGYGVSLGLGVEHALVSGNDVLTGRKDRALNFMSELYTAQMELTFRMDNGKLLKYDARFAPFVALGVGVGKYDVFNALHILGSLGTTNLTPLQAMYATAPTMGIADGVDEVHKATVARNVLKGYRPHEGNWPTEYLPAKRQAAWEAFEPRFVEDPQLREMAEGYAAYIAKKG